MLISGEPDLEWLLDNLTAAQAKRSSDDLDEQLDGMRQAAYAAINFVRREAMIAERENECANVLWPLIDAAVLLDDLRLHRENSQISTRKKGGRKKKGRWSLDFRAQAAAVMDLHMQSGASEADAAARTVRDLPAGVFGTRSAHQETAPSVSLSNFRKDLLAGDRGTDTLKTFNTARKAALVLNAEEPEKAAKSLTDMLNRSHRPTAP